MDAFSANDPLPPGPLPYADIYDPQSLNKYAYALNSPVMYVDPDGHEPCCTAVEEVSQEVVDEVVKRYLPAAAKAASNFVKVVGAGVGALLGLTVGAEPVGVGSSLDDHPEVKREYEKQLAERAQEKQEEKRKSSEQIRKEWEKKNGKPWPKDKETGKQQDVQHKKAKADGGSDNLRNVEPKPHKQHVDHHKKRGDFVRWGKRSKKKKAQ